MVELEDVKDASTFDFRWPEMVEHFSHGWEGRVVFGRRTSKFVHGVGGRTVYGRPRVHTVTFLDGHAIVEGVACDDFERSRCLLSLLKRGSGHSLVRQMGELPPGYEGFEIVQHADEIRAPYSKRSLALKIAIDDLHAWVEHAVLRRRQQGRE